MYTAKNAELTIFGGYYCWDIFDPEGFKICTIMGANKESAEADKDALLSHLNK